MLIVDGHPELAWNALQWGRDLTRSALTIRALEGGTAGKGRGLGTVALPELRRGRVAPCFAELLAARGYAAADVTAMMHGNWLRPLRELWGER
jgi:membrane dipeptidase